MPAASLETHCLECGKELIRNRIIRGRCATCNAFHYMELKYGKLPMSIVWGGDE